MSSTYSGLTAISIPSSVTYNGKSYTVTEIADYAFVGCRATSVSLPSSLTNIGTYAFHRSSIQSIDLSNVTTIEGQALAGCESLTTVTGFNNITIVPSNLFSGSAITSISMPNITKIEGGAFYNCTKLVSINLGTKLKEISSNSDVFMGCMSLKSITYPSTVTSVGYIDAFPQSTVITCNATKPPQAYTSSTSLSSRIIYVPSSEKSKYASTTPWSYFTINPVKITSMSFEEANPSVASGKFYKQMPVVQPSDAFRKNDFTWSSSNPNVASVESSGRVSGEKKGTAVITAISTDGSNISAYYTISVTDPEVSSISLNKSTATITDSETLQLTATVYPTGAVGTIEWSSSNSSVATVSDKGMVTGVKKGTATITAKSGEVSEKCVVTVTDTPAESVTLNKTEIVVEYGNSETLVATVKPTTTTNKTITWKSSNTSVASVSNGTVKALKAGTATITATCGSVSATCKVTVPSVPVTSVTLDSKNKEIIIGSTATLTATVTPSYATNNSVSWTTSDAAVATVTSKGVVTGISAGTATITATAGGKSASCIVTVKPILATSVTLNKTTVNLKVNGSETITATVAPTTTTDKSIVWTSSDESVATVINGKITALKVGTAKITAACGSVKSGECTVTVSPIEVTSVTLDVATKTIKIGDGFKLTATVKPDNATDKSVTWTSSNASIATVDASGNVKGVKDGEATITAKTTNGKTADCKVTVNPIQAESITIEPASVTLNVGGKTTLKATVLPENTTNPAVTWSINKPDVAQVDASTGEVTAISAGQATITATCGAVTKTCVVTVNPVLAEKLTVSAPAKQVMVRDDLQLTATVAPENTTDKTLIWSSSNNEIAKVDQNGLVTTALITGEVTITAKSKGNESAYGTLQIEVIPRSREIDGVIYEMVYVNPGSISDNDYIKVIGYTAGQPASGDLTILPQILTSKDRTLPVKEVEKDAFKGNAAITSIVIPKSVSKVGAGAFANCSNLRDVRIDDSSETLECGDGMFAGSPFVSLYLGRHTSGTVLSGHKSLDDLQIGTSVTKIDANEFTGCAPITNLVVYATTPPAMPDNGFDQTVYDNTVLRVPDDVVNKYKTAQGWTKFNHNNILGINQIPAQSISLSSELSLTVGGSKRLEVAFNPTDVTSKALSWSSSNESVASVSSTGVVVALTPGEVTITATTTNGKTAECKVTVNPIRVTTVTVEPAVAEITVGDVLSLSASIDPDDATDQTIGWSSSDTAVATVDDDGNVKAIAPGAVTVTAKSPDGPSAECQITVVAATIDVQDIVLDAESLTLRAGASGVLKAHIYPENATDPSVTWSSSEPEVATVDESGNVKALKQGMTIIAATTANGLSAECLVTVTPASKPATGIALNLSQVELLQWEEVQLIATVTPAESDDVVVWSTSDMEVANVDDYGRVTTLSPGTVTITATTISGVSASCVVKVAAAPMGLSLDRDNADLVVGGELQLNAEVYPAEAAAHKLVWRSSNPEIATVDMQGKVKGIAPGSATVTVRTVNGLEIGCVVNVKMAPTSIALNFTHYEIAEQDRMQLIAIVEPTDMTYNEVTWSSSNEQVVYVNEDGIINSYSPGSAIVTARTINGLEATCEVTVVGYDVRLNVLSATLYKGEQLSMIARVTPGKGYYAADGWSSSDEGVTTVADDGTVTGVKTGTAYINYYVGSSGYDYCPVIVIERNPVEEGPEITFSEVAVRPGQTLELGNTVDPEVTWTSTDESVIKVDDNGNIVAVGEGEAIVIATDASGVTSTCSVVVATQAPIPVMDIFFNGDQTLKEGESLQLMPEIYPYEAYNKTLTYESNAPEIVAVDENGVITALRAGEAVITATTSNGLLATCVVIVEANTTGIEDVDSDSSISVRVENREIIIVAPEGANVEVYNLSGVLVRRTRDHRISDLTRGVYVVRVAGKAFKVSL
ncbi:MAG: leucine-rich repeat protein [Bacteroides sp.]|nr:leucine-rich repeat protein [Bacteroides sp.]